MREGSEGGVMDKFGCGHPYTPENTCWGGKCRECKRARDRNRTERLLESERARKRVFIREQRYRRQGREVPGPPKAGNYHGPFSPADWDAREAARAARDGAS